MVKGFLESLAYSPDSENHFLDGKEEFEEIFLSTSEGKVHGYVLEPKKKTVGTVLHFHGSGYNISRHYYHVKWLPSMGFRVVLFDYPGYGSSEGKATRKSVVEAGLAFFNHIESHYPSQPVFFFGQSLGGAISLSCYQKVKESKMLKGVVLDSTFSSYGSMAGVKFSKKLGFLGKAVANVVKIAFDKQDDPSENLSSIQHPLLILHSVTDDVVPFSEAQKLLAFSPGDVEFWGQNGPGHVSLFKEEGSKYRSQLVEWMLKQINGG